MADCQNVAFGVIETHKSFDDWAKGSILFKKVIGRVTGKNVSSRFGIDIRGR